MVGAVIVKDGRIIGEGYHSRVGHPHAEVEAIRALVEDPKGATMYVSLEPCSHHGRTPPCTDALLQSGISRVIVALRDPHPKARGGITVLTEAGIECRTGLMEVQARDINHIFFDSLRLRRPAISLKLAQSINGCVAREDGSSKWISSPEARKYVHQLRGAHQAILVGVSTVVADDPKLDSRDFDISRSPIAVVLDRQGRIPLQAGLLQKKETIVYTTASAETLLMARLNGEIQAEVVSLGSGTEGYSTLWDLMLQDLYAREIRSLFVEGGSEVGNFLVSEGLVDWLYLFIGPQIFAKGSLTGISPVTEMSLQRHSLEYFGDTILLEGRVSCLPA
jgi:diaminohydroxyphosphoribosylaminopyrimidine deaminase/5-amino-6-(5-phosphoribosylamino)uracil reductase